MSVVKIRQKPQTRLVMKKNFKDRIVEEFSIAELPEKGNISESTYWDAEDVNEDFSLYIEKPIDSSVLEKHSLSFAAFRPKAFVFFLKDFMLYTLEHLEAIFVTDCELIDNLIYRLTALNVDDSYWQDRIKLLNSGQIKVILEFLNFLKEELPKQQSYQAEDYLMECLDEAILAWKKVDT